MSDWPYIEKAIQTSLHLTQQFVSILQAPNNTSSNFKMYNSVGGGGAGIPFNLLG